MSDLVEQLENVGCNRAPFTPDHADCICRLTHAGAGEIKTLRSALDELVDAYVAELTGEGWSKLEVERQAVVRNARSALCAHVWQEHDVYGENCTKCGEHRT